MGEKRIGRQTPTQSFVLPYEKTYGQDAIDLYNATGREAQEWQQLLLCDMLAVNEDDLWTHTKFGYSVPRRNGKNEVVAIRELYGLFHGERILHTAHRTTTSHAAWERLCAMLSKLGYVENENFKTAKQFGLERIEMMDGDGRVSFRTRSSKGGLGEGFDLLVIDEAQEYQDDQESALKYVVTDSKNPQTVFLGTPPTPVSSGTVFTKYRKSTMCGDNKNAAWEEWSVEKKSDPNDKDLWYEANPSLGTVFTERSVEDEIGNDDVDFNIQRLGLWIRYNQHSVISEVDWKSMQVDVMPKIKGKLFVGVKYNKNGQSVSMSIAVKTDDDKIFIESIGCKNINFGNDWIIEFLTKADIKRVAVDGANGQRILAEQMKKEHLKAPILPTVNEIILANAKFEQGLFAKNIRHGYQPSLQQCATNCDKRSIGSNGGFGYTSIKDGVDISLLDSAILAYWACVEDKPEIRQKVTY